MTNEFRKPYHPNPFINAFFENHAPWVVDAHYAIFHDGASMELTASGPGMMKEPSENPYERQQIVVKYFDVLAKRATQAFQRRKDDLVDADLEGEEADEALAELKQLRTLAQKAKADLREAKDELKAVTPFTATAKRREAARSAKARQKLRDQVFEIKL